MTNEVELKDDGNARTYTSKGPRIKTLEQLIAECEINLDDWIIERHIINKWEVGANLNDGTITVEPLFQVKVWLVNKRPEPLEPVITKVDLQVKPYSPPAEKSYEAKKVLVLADPHFGFLKDVNTGELEPFHDQKALDIAVRVAQTSNPDVIAILGDILDLAEWSDKFVRSPDMYNTTQPAIEAAAVWLAQLREACPASEIFLLEGNHEKRVMTAINKQIPAAYGLRTSSGLPLLSLPVMLDLEKLGIEYVGNYPEGELWATDDIRIIHGSTVRAKSGATATAIVDDATATTVFGHVHRQELVSRTLFNRYGSKVISAFTPGCLCRIDGIVPSVNGRMNWQQGIGMLEVIDEQVIITPVMINNGKAYYGGVKLG